ncbi:MAG: glycosyltransferase family 2 protein [Planctomycetes bacterium]|nr:glycosyltransferase family 2 protein [Planctomycetota bacterium]
MKLSIVIPVYNERQTLQELVRRVLAAPVEVAREVVLVDDGSTDGSSALLDALPAAHPGADLKIIHQPRNRGKGAAVRTGLAQAAGDFVIIQDADLEYDPRDYRQMLEPLIDGRADVVFGSRFLGGPHRVLYFWHYVANQGLTLITNILYDINLSDMETCYKAFTQAVNRSLFLDSERFGIEPELTAEVCRRHYRIYEVPISYSGRSYAEGKKITWKDAFPAVWTLFRCRMRRSFASGL